MSGNGLLERAFAVASEPSICLLGATSASAGAGGLPLLTD